MRVQPWLLTGSSLVLLALAPISAARAQDATNPALVAAFQAYQQSQDDTTKQNLQAACVAAGFQGIDDCVSALTGVAPVQEAPPPPPPSSEEAPPPPAPSEEAPPPPPPSSEAAPPPPSSEEAPPPAPSSEQAPPPPPPSSEEAAPPAAPPVSSEEAAPPAPSSEQAPAPEAPSSEQTPAPAPSSQQAAPPAPSSEQAPAPVATSSEQASPLAALQGAVAAYNAGVDKLAAGDASGQADVDQAKAQIDQICTTGGFADTNACLAQFNLALKPLPAAPAQPSAEPQPAAPSSEQQPAAPSSEAPPAPPASSEQPISEMPQASEPVDPSAVEVLPDSFGIQDAAPILDSVKDADNASSSEQPAQPAAPPAPPPQDDQQAQQDIQPPPQQDQSTQTDKPQKTLDADNFSLLPAAPPDSGIKVVDFGPKPNGPGPKPNGPKPNQPNQPNPPPGPPQGVIFQIGINIVINNPEQERDRFYDPRQDKISYEQLSRGRVRETIIRRDGSRVVTIRDKYGDVLQRSKILPNGKEIVLATYDPRDEDINNWRDPGDDLPPLRLTIPADQYILDADTADDDNVYTFFDQPPVEKVKRIYTIDEVKRSARLRDSVRRLEVGNLTFDTGKATISRDQVGTLQSVADAMLKMLGRNPGEVFLIEGHTDAVGSDVANLVLSDQRAATVARILTDFYGIPPENLVTQGYGERFLKVKTDLAEPINRRVTFKRITPLISYASN